MIHTKRRKAGISDVLATVIIVAATVAIALVAVAYFTGLVGGSTQTQRIVISPVSRLCITSDKQGSFNVTTLYLKIENMGSKSIQITGMQVGDKYIDKSSNPIIIPAGKTEIIKENITDRNFTVGSTYDVQLYTSGNVQLLSTEVQAYSSNNCPS